MRFPIRNGLAGRCTFAVFILTLLGLASRAADAQVPDKAAPAAAAREWPAYGRDAGGSRYSPLDDITPANVARLRVAWTYRTGEAGVEVGSDRGTSFEATPVVVDGVMYFPTPLGKVIALDPATGKERWVHDAKVGPDQHFADWASRGVAVWLDPEAPAGGACRRRVFYATIDARLLSLDAATGRPCAGFGDAGTVDLRRGLRNAPAYTEEYEETSPPAVVDGVVVVGSAVADNNRFDAPSGEVRGFDARTGRLRWTWDPVPQDPKDPAYATWRGPQAHRSGAANAWSAIVADPERGLVFVPTGSAAPDYFGGLRKGENRYANSIVALRARTGDVVWSFQTVHHDIWDYDNAAPPALVDVRVGGRSVPAVLQATKTGMLFVLDRATGRPIFPVEERPVPRSTVPGEESWPTQPFTVATPPLSPHHFKAEDAWGPTPADREACLAQMKPLRSEGIFTPPSLEGTLVVPSNVGGAHWGGVAVDPERQIAVVPVNRVAALVQLFPMEGTDMKKVHAEGERLGDEITHMKGTPYMMRRRILRGPSGLPCTPPPWGSLVAVDLTTGARKWEVPLGTLQALMPAGVTADPSWGSVNLGGAHWGGVAVDPARQIAVVPVNRVAALVQLFKMDGADMARIHSEG
ncbi:MAG TPA: pyrroloquinoline quinone-dependent dehydrogenase, partial [Longimicrobiales bacterium]|nr:pyrroloquinoline quinone-dependent dehydrogenase [Longimicrobiales bacterium]